MSKTFNQILAFLKGKKTYIVGVGALVYAIGISQKWWDSSADVWGVLGASGAITIRAAIANLLQDALNDPAVTGKEYQTDIQPVIKKAP